MGNLFRAAIEHVGVRAGRGCQTMSVHVDQPGVERLLAQIKKQQAFDFTGYKRTSFERRLRRRMQEVSVADCAEYSDMLAREPNEVAALLGTVLINVTGCFRDARCWKLIADEVIDAVIQQRAPDESIRIWSAGTATGEEACSLAMLFAEALGADAYQRRVRIFATDVDEDALETARKAKYSARAVRSVPPALLEKYFERCGEAFRFHPALRRSMTFRRHDVVRDEPIDRIDLLACRNVLMYFDAQAQATATSQLHAALRDGGFVIFGKAEMLAARIPNFKPISMAGRIFRKVDCQQAFPSSTG